MRNPVVGIILTAVLPTASLLAARSFADFEGDYQGTVRYANSVYTPYAATGVASIRVKVPRTGDSAKLGVRGSVMDADTTLPLSGRLTLTKKTMLATSALFNLPLPGRGFRVKGRLTRRSFSVEGTMLADATVATIRTIIKVKPRGKRKKQLTISHHIAGTTFPFFYEYYFDATGKAAR